MGYNTGKIYKLLCDDDHYYYGSTITTLINRFYNHKSSSKLMTSKLYKHINNIGWDKVKILLVEEYPCNNREELRMKENEYIVSSTNDKLCLNTLKSHITDEEREERCRKYYLENKESIIKRNDNYYKIHKEEIQNKRHEIYLKCKPEVNYKSKIYHLENKQKIKKQRKEYYDKNKEVICQKKKEQRITSAGDEELKRKRKEYRNKNKDRINMLKRITYSKTKSISNL